MASTGIHIELYIGLCVETFKQLSSTISQCVTQSAFSTGNTMKSIRDSHFPSYHTKEEVAPEQIGKVFAATKLASFKNCNKDKSRFLKFPLTN